MRPLLLFGITVVAVACDKPPADLTIITFPVSALGAEAVVLERQLGRFMDRHRSVRIVPRRTPDAADQRHQLYVQWLNARARDPDVLQMDVIWTAEFAAAGWILSLERFEPPVDRFLAPAIEANTWRGRLYALPWFVDVGMLYWRTDLMPAAPQTLEELAARAAGSRAEGLEGGFVWQGARYEGLVTVFAEVLGGMGGRIMDRDGRVRVDSDAGVRALAYLVNLVASGATPRDVLAWQEEQVRFAFQNRRAAFMRNWPYAYPLLQDRDHSRVAGRFAVAPMPAAGGTPTATLGGSQLAINANSEHPDVAYALIDFLTQPEQMLERARVAGQYPARTELYRDGSLESALPVSGETALRILERATPRPVTPVYTELSGILQVWLHRALSRQIEPRAALERAAREMRTLLERVELAPRAADAR